MSRATVHVAGRWLDLHGAPAGDLQDSTIWRDQTRGSEGYSGDYEASWSWAPRRIPAWFRPGARVEIREGGLTVWRGFLGEPSGGEDHAAFGDGADSVNWFIAGNDAGNLNGDLDEATARGMRWTRAGGNMNGGDYPLARDEMMVSVAEALNRLGKATGMVWYVTRGVGSLRTEKTAPDFVLADGSAYLGTTDQNYVTALSAYYATAVDSEGKPTAPTHTTPSTFHVPPSRDDVAATRVGGHREAVVNITALGALTLTQALDIAGQRFAQIGARAGWTNGFEMTALNSRRWSNSQPAPMSARAGDRIRIPGVTDMIASTTYGTAVTVTAGKVTRYHAEQRVTVEPVGMVERDFAGALAAAQAPETQVETL